ncbi:amylo-alpha-1,6-glucosidase [Anaerocolumna sp. AGMB13020]|uniref:amylo-alpha-1,6-glucosidase n=1 Tax=Anaerocolumna sp. AGMB13020 TaxID=3081750 RepID=UPI002955A2A4|nr:amylo-alpha-1,6-glucosidase [Anaerocolumna sp. AGMB13020]WOO34524.1 amylo-alpha-1,6-glucosidase [Anaerocolumna sp. AGMB13020]
MKFIYGKNDWKTLERGQENCYLITNGLGGYSSLTAIGSNTRNDHALLMACTIAPNHRYHLVTRLDEQLEIGEEDKIELSSQTYVNQAKDQTGFKYLNQFFFEHYPVWTYQADAVEIRKSAVMAHGENTIGIRYFITNSGSKNVKLSITPMLQFVQKGEILNKNQIFSITDKEIISNGITLQYATSGKVSSYATEYISDLYYSYDARDGRDAIGVTAHNHNISITVKGKEEKVLDLIYSLENTNHTIEELMATERARQTKLVEQSQMKDELGKQLVKSADQYLVNRESTKGRTLMAGYPFFADWGRDTMISMVGCCISTKRFEEAKSIFRTFMLYSKNGLMPNMFPEGGNDPLYNTVDASLLFIAAVYEYYQESGDLDFVKEAYPVMEDIIKWYKQGTDYHIKMDTDGLIMAGSGLEQVTWMDVRFGEILPTPRHGKPVEINAYWYNDLRIMGVFARLLEKEDIPYEELAKQVSRSFAEQFWNKKENCLKDLVSGEAADYQIRCNQIWAVSQPFSILEKEQEKQVVNKVYETLYTPYGLRSLSKYDKDFKPVYGGSHFNRDMAYHQGTVWAFPLGAYYLAYLKVNEYSDSAVTRVREQLEVLESCMREGCVGQIAEIYDGLNPTISQGCFAQAWSVSELLRVFAKLESCK